MVRTTQTSGRIPHSLQRVQDLEAHGAARDDVLGELDLAPQLVVEVRDLGVAAQLGVDGRLRVFRGLEVAWAAKG